jgi:hypothetical protein
VYQLGLASTCGVWTTLLLLAGLVYKHDLRDVTQRDLLCTEVAGLCAIFEETGNDASRLWSANSTMPQVHRAFAGLLDPSSEHRTLLNILGQLQRDVHLKKSTPSCINLDVWRRVIDRQQQLGRLLRRFRINDHTRLVESAPLLRVSLPKLSPFQKCLVSARMYHHMQPHPSQGGTFSTSLPIRKMSALRPAADFPVHLGDHGGVCEQLTRVGSQSVAVIVTALPPLNNLLI